MLFTSPSNHGVKGVGGSVHVMEVSNLVKKKIHSSCEIGYFAETNMYVLAVCDTIIGYRSIYYVMCRFYCILRSIYLLNEQITGVQSNQHSSLRTFHAKTEKNKLGSMEPQGLSSTDLSWYCSSSSNI